MKHLKLLGLIIGMIVWLAACSIDLSEPSHKPPEPIIVTETPGADQAIGSGTAATPPAWANLNLSGHLIFVQIPRQIVKLDLASGARTVLFEAPGNGFVSAAQVSRDGQWIVMAYAPPKDPSLQSVNTDLYVMPADGSAPPQVLLQRTDDKEDYFNPVWSADGHYVYYSHLMPDPTSSRKYTNFKYDLERVVYPNGQPQKLIDDAFWPRLSKDGIHLAYVSFVPATNSNDLYLANADGSAAKLVMPAGSFFAVDAPVFSADGQTLLFSAVGDVQPPAASWLDQLLGVQIAEAHTVPSDWWRVSIAGGQPERLTRINDTGLYGDFSPDGQHVAFVSVTGVYVMKPDGSNLVQLVKDAVGGTVSWTP
jgi:Tol biopolymer transport system component